MHRYRQYRRAVRSSQCHHSSQHEIREGRVPAEMATRRVRALDRRTDSLIKELGIVFCRARQERTRDATWHPQPSQQQCNENDDVDEVSKPRVARTILELIERAKAANRERRPRSRRPRAAHTQGVGEKRKLGVPSRRKRWPESERCNLCLYCCVTTTRSRGPKEEEKRRKRGGKGGKVGEKV